MPKDFGGLGFRLFSYINLALLLKLASKIAAGEDYLWTDMLTLSITSREGVLWCGKASLKQESIF